MRSKLPNLSATDQTNLNQGERLPVSRFALFFLPLLIGLALDLWTKHYTFTKYFDPYSTQVPAWWIEGVFGIQTSTNPGALFGFGKGFSSVFAAFSVVALAGIGVWLFWLGAAFDRWLTFALGLVSGGILGNLYDRIGLGHDPSYPDVLWGNVRDWIYFRLEGVPFFDPWPNFNIADSCLVCGAIMLVIHAFVYAEPETDGTPKASGELANETDDS